MVAAQAHIAELEARIRELEEERRLRDLEAGEVRLEEETPNERIVAERAARAYRELQGGLTYDEALREAIRASEQAATAPSRASPPSEAGWRGLDIAGFQTRLDWRNLLNSEQDGSATPAPSAVAEPEECVVCLDRPRRAALDPCSHAVTCEECAQELLNRGDRCPVCRERIARIVPGNFNQTYVGRGRLYVGRGRL